MMDPNQRRLSHCAAEFIGPDTCFPGQYLEEGRAVQLREIVSEYLRSEITSQLHPYPSGRDGRLRTPAPVLDGHVVFRYQSSGH